MLKTFCIATFLNGANGNKQVTAIVAASSQRKAADALNVGLHHFRGYASETGNRIQIEVATAQPGVVFWQSINACGKDADLWFSWEAQPKYANLAKSTRVWARNGGKR